MSINKTITVRFTEDDLRRLRRVLGFHSPKGRSIPIGKLIRMLVNIEYDGLRAMHPKDRTLDLVD